MKFLDADVIDGVMQRARGHEPEPHHVSQERRVCLAIGRATEHEATEVRDVWQTTGQE